MFIQTEQMPDPARMKFYPGEPVLASGAAEFPDEESAARSPLARRLFDVDGIDEVTLYPDSVMVVKEDGVDWQVLKPAVLGAIMDHFGSGQPVVSEGTASRAHVEIADFQDEGDPETVAQVTDLIDTRIRPAASQSGGNVSYYGIKGDTLYLELTGTAFALLPGIENVMRHYLPQIESVKSHLDAIPKPGLETNEARTIQELLETRINPSIASHGGHITLIDVKDDTVFVRLEGGCQGCGMADVTLRQGVEVEIKEAVPSIAHILDVTDHADGKNPYYLSR
jgi:Fe-S cluster biogenesis protein NfuA